MVCHLLGQSANHAPAPLFPPIAPVLPVAALLFPASPLALREQQAVEATTTRPVPLPGQKAAPPVTLGKYWALSSPGLALTACYPTARSIRPYLWEHCRHYLAPSCDAPPASLAAQLPGLARVLAHLAPHLQTVEPIELSNPGQLHGRGVSVFPPGSLPSHYTHLPSRHLRPVGVVELVQGGAHFYLFWLADDRPPVLVYELRVGALSEAELQEFLYQFSYARHVGEQVSAGLFKLSRKVYGLIQYPEPEPAPRPISAWCAAQIRWGICRYNAYRYLLRQPDQMATSLEQLGQQLATFRLAGQYLERGYLHFPGRAVAELPDATQF